MTMTMTRRTLLGAFGCGLIFAIGLGVSGMTQPGKVVGFLDLFGGSWDPSLGLVMAAAVAVHASFLRWMRRGPSSAAPEIDSCAALTDDELAGISPRARNGFLGTRGGVMAGAAIFGVGWGLGGYCPGPALVSLVSLAPGVLLFTATMLGGMLIYQVLLHPRAASPGGPELTARPTTRPKLAR
ncbi:MAG: DUF6691 family protein [Myxococcales bacterium]